LPFGVFDALNVVDSPPEINIYVTVDGQLVCIPSRPERRRWSGSISTPPLAAVRCARLSRFGGSATPFWLGRSPCFGGILPLTLAELGRAPRDRSGDKAQGCLAVREARSLPRNHGSPGAAEAGGRRLTPRAVSRGTPPLCGCLQPPPAGYPGVGDRS
jgi:hypothetical protein